MCSPTYIMCGHADVWYTWACPSWVCPHYKIRIIYIVLPMHYLRGHADVYYTWAFLRWICQCKIYVWYTSFCQCWCKLYAHRACANICISYVGMQMYNTWVCLMWVWTCQIYVWYTLVCPCIFCLGVLMYNMRGHAHGADVKYAHIMHV